MLFQGQPIGTHPIMGSAAPIELITSLSIGDSTTAAAGSILLADAGTGLLGLADAPSDSIGLDDAADGGSIGVADDNVGSVLLDDDR